MFLKAPRLATTRNARTCNDHTEDNNDNDDDDEDNTTTGPGATTNDYESPGATGSDKIV